MLVSKQQGQKMNVLENFLYDTENYYKLLKDIDKELIDKKIDISDKKQALELLYYVNSVESDILDSQENAMKYVNFTTYKLNGIIQKLYKKIFTDFSYKELIETESKP